jgi:hypothetical protein
MVHHREEYSYRIRPAHFENAANLRLFSAVLVHVPQHGGHGRSLSVGTRYASIDDPASLRHINGLQRSLRCHARIDQQEAQQQSWKSSQTLLDSHGNRPSHLALARGVHSRMRRNLPKCFSGT